MDKSAFTHARKKYSFEVYESLNQNFISEIFTDFLTRKFHGFKVLGIDGSILTLPNSDSLRDEFSVWNGRNGESNPLARISTLYDCLNKVTYHSVIESKTIGERSLAERHIESTSLDSNHVITLDRGYDSAWLFHKITDSGAHFCARMPFRSKSVKAFVESDEVDITFTEKLNPNAKETCFKHGISHEEITLRLVKIELPSGEIEILATSLLDNNLDLTFFKELYHLRWQTEELYKVMKNRILMAKFMSKTVHGIKQEFYARVFMLNITSSIRLISEDNLTKERRKNKVQINFKSALSKVRNVGIYLFGSVRKCMKTIKYLIEQMALDLVEVKPDRSYPRIPKKMRVGRIYQTYTGI